jgi:hypothetical protein
MIKSRRMGFARHVARMKGEVYRVLVWKPDGKRPLRDPAVDGRIVLRRFFRKRDVVVWTELSWLRMETGGGHL